MKNISLILNGILAIAIAVLYVLHFSSPSDQVDNKVDNENINDENLTVAFVNADSLQKNFDMFKDMQKELEEESKKLDAEYKNRAVGLQKEFNDFQRTAQTLTINQAKALQDDLLKKEQNLRVYQESLAQQLLKKEAELNKELYQKVAEYLENYGKTNNLQLVVRYNRGSDILFAKESMDITDKIVDGLNKNYNQKAETAVSDSTSTKK